MPKQRENDQISQHSRPQRNMKMKKVFDPSDTHVPKKRKKFGLKVSEPDLNLSKSETDLETPQNVLTGSCSVCLKDSPLKKLIECPICLIKVHKKCLFVSEPVWKFKCTHCFWFCKTCRMDHCNRCFEKESNFEFHRCKTCNVGIHTKCYRINEFKPISPYKSGVYMCQPCKNLIPQQESPEEKKEQELSSSEKKALLMNILTKVPDFEQEWEVPDITGWDKFQVYNYLKDRNLPVEVTDLIIKKELDGEAVQCLRRSDIILNMELKLGPALKFYKEIRILQSKNTSCKVYWDSDLP